MDTRRGERPAARGGQTNGGARRRRTAMSKRPTAPNPDASRRAFDRRSRKAFDDAAWNGEFKLSEDGHAYPHDTLWLAWQAGVAWQRRQLTPLAVARRTLNGIDFTAM